ncbi:unnamed protein product [Caenorhabditis sp. 36 PRJEB53466]|nr:unnamed protein product [Caenorhabditis sp. 36 PRJEB53466]
MKFSILVCFFAFFIISDAVAPVSDALRVEFTDLAQKRLKYLLEHGPLTEPFLTMSIVVTDCHSAAGLPKISIKSKQMILEEETCGTRQMRGWCAEKPGRSGMLTARDQKSNRTALAHFQCLSVDPSSQMGGPFWTERRVRLTINFLIVFSFVGMTYSWYYTCTRPRPIHPSKILPGNRSAESDSFENITFDTNRSKSRIARSNRSSFSVAPKKFRIIA